MKLCSKQVLSWLPETLHCRKVVVDQASNPPPRPPVSVLLSPQSSSKLLPHHHSPPRCFRRVSPSITVFGFVRRRRRFFISRSFPCHRRK
ncbi:hypothetical protein E6C27_scaffold385G00400 [Cucumis melo var. makuwa]|uniref:Uncharacterized protein n=1 Tax=Cucumis melo var. makuwa TaxID=1194695 RepID=A0A5A7U181_CUCMM|nr:hypothetical protein E6C27_scaffold385G00400 [Cucumis melo var. makuwa]